MSQEKDYILYYLSDCCGEYGSEIMDRCPRCGEYCVVIHEKYWLK